MKIGVIFWLATYIISSVLFFSVALIITVLGLRDLKFLTRSQRKVK
ncbi:hypothetical protein [Candidatus Kryptobacter tengchongensis]|uniref:Uncharacterized protein n=1 Tax=Kryptobacter tengchongensis TaxID=1643429 RepID=A0A656D377_KRYT1|nr:hypothetical protein [Candidatus Kryptobacter tengchongensis]CUS98033.1 hypothetical protein JGI24_00372 [Candidatus Kryptobacter tengchongensis]